MTFEEWWESTGRAEQYADEPVVREVAEAAWDADRWMSVSERPPTKDDADDTSKVIGWFKTSRLSETIGWKWAIDCTDVTHWMPLPEPPQEGEG
jgi:hypothetical protein